MDIAHFLVGLSFLVAAAAAFEIRTRSAPNPWIMLAGALLAHGLSEWVGMVSDAMPLAPALILASGVFHGLSGIVLLESARLTLPAGRLRRAGLAIQALFASILVLAVVVQGGLSPLEARWFVVPALVAGAVMLAVQAARAGGWMRVGLAAAALGMAVTAGSETFEDWLRLAVIPELAGALLLAAGMGVADHRQLDWPADYRRIRTRRVLAFVLLLGVCLGVGILAIESGAARSREEIRRNGQVTAAMLASQVEVLLATADLSAAVVAYWPETAAALTATDADREAANRTLDLRLDAIRVEQGLSMVYVMDPSGRTLLSTNREGADSLIGKNFAFRPYFTEAKAGRPGRYWARGVITGSRGFYAAHAVKAGDGRILGVVAVKQDASRLIPVLRGTPNAMLVSRDGVVFASYDDAFLDCTLTPPDASVVERLRSTKQYGDGPFQPLFPEGLQPGTPFQVAGQSRVPVLSSTHGDGWRILALADGAVFTAQRLVVVAMLALVCCLVLAGYAAVAALGDRNWELEAGRQRQRLAVQAAETAQAAAEAAARAKSTFLATMSHEIRTPLNGVIGMSDILLQQPLDRSAREAAGVIRRSGETLLALVNDILDFSKIEAGRLELEHRIIDIRHAGDEVLALFRPAATAKGIDLILRVEADVPTVTAGDPVRFRQVLSNLVSNGVKFTRHGAVTLAIARSPADATAAHGWLHLGVSDTGIGIPQESLPRLFRMFSQVEAGTTRRFGGTGLGLAITQRLVEAMGGAISVQSRQGVGSEFRIRLPLPDPARLPNDPTPESLPALPARGLRVLLAEDDAVNRMVAKGLLGHLGAVVEEVEDGIAAVTAWEGGGYDVVLMDVQMPRMDGLAATRAIRDHETERGLPRTPIIALTANAFSEDRIACIIAGMDDLVAKPVTLDVLAKALSRNLRR